MVTTESERRPMTEEKVKEILDDYSKKIALLQKQIKTVKYFDEAKLLFLDIHAITHSSYISIDSNPTFFDILINGLGDDDYSIMPLETDETIAWHIWHITRIEDIVGNLLIYKHDQVFCDEYALKMNTTVKDTGNAMTDKEIIDFSRQIVKKELLDYRNAVGLRTNEIIASLTPADVKRKADEEDKGRLLKEGCLTKDKDSIWLKDFWGRLTIAGMLCLPLTRHHMMHLPDSFAIKRFIYNSN